MVDHKTTIRVPAELHIEARVKALRLGTNLSKVVREFLQLWVAGEIQLPSQEEQTEQ